MRGYVIKITHTATEYNKFFQTGEKKEYFIVKGGYVKPTNYGFILQEDLYKSKSATKRVITRYKSYKTPEDPSFTTSYDVVEID